MVEVQAPGLEAKVRREARKMVARGGVKVVLAALTLVLSISLGGAQVFILMLLPLHHWAATTSGPIGRVMWSVPAGVAGTFLVWAGIYMTVGEAQPAIWLGPLVALIACTYAMWRLVQRGVAKRQILGMLEHQVEPRAFGRDHPGIPG